MYFRGEIEDLKSKGLLLVQSTGGVSGGSCWDSSNPQPYRNTTIPITQFPLYKELTKHFNMYYVDFKTNEFTEYEYYGNNTEYEYYFVSWEDLFKNVTVVQPIDLGI